MLFLLFFLVGNKDTLVAELAWPYYIFDGSKARLKPCTTIWGINPRTTKGLINQAPTLKGYKAMRFSPQVPCSIHQFLYGVSSMVDSANKVCSLFVWHDEGGEPDSLLFGEVFTISAPESGKVCWNIYSLGSPLYVTEPFWAGIQEKDTLFPTMVFDEIPSIPARYSEDGVVWDTVWVDYFCGVVVAAEHGVAEVGTNQQFAPTRIECSPNPVRREAVISYRIPSCQSTQDGFPTVCLKIYDAAGRLLKTLIDRELEPGFYNLPINMEKVLSGIYFISLEIKDRREKTENRKIKKLVVIK